MDDDTHSRIILLTEERLAGDGSGHGMDHTLRVCRNALTIQASEGGDADIIELAALLHDVDDRKLFGDDHLTCSYACQVMEETGFSQDVRDAVVSIIQDLSFKGTDTKVPDSLEGRIVQDADRLDAIGAIGIARAFSYGGSRGRVMYDPAISPDTNMDERTYFANRGTTVNHFHEKLLLLKDMMNTETGRRMAGSRHQFMLEFLDRFVKEWNGDC